MVRLAMSDMSVVFKVIGGRKMKSFVKKVCSMLLTVSLTLSCFIGSCAYAESKNNQQWVVGNYTFSEEKIDEHQSDLYIQDKSSGQVDVVRLVNHPDGTRQSYVWHDVSSDFAINELKDYSFSAVFSKGKLQIQNDLQGSTQVLDESEMFAFSSRQVAYPSPWYNYPIQTGSVVGDITSVANSISIFYAVFFGIPTVVASVLATWVVNSGIPNVYYTSQKTYRLLDALTQEYYYTYHWYSDPVYTNLITSEQTGTYTIYLG